MYVWHACWCACINPDCEPQAGSSELTARLQSEQQAELVASAAGASSSGRPAQPGIKLPNDIVPCSKVRLYITCKACHGFKYYSHCTAHTVRHIPMLHQLSA